MKAPSRPRATGLASGEHRAAPGRTQAPGGRGDGPALLEPRLLVFFLVGCVLFGYPVLGMFSAPARIAGIPALYLYLFVAWGLFVGALAWLVERRERPRQPARGAGRRSP